MATSQLSGFVQQLGYALQPERIETSDGELLNQYVSRHDDAAFTSLVRRHGPMVWGVCCRVLCCRHLAEDAFQATFLVLVRRAAAVKPRERVGSWLYGVAYQTALKARAMASRRALRERQVEQMPEPAAKQDDWNDLRGVLDRELNCLPEKYRSAIVLCDLEDKTRRQVARQLGVPEGTLSGWLSRGRVLLAKRLAAHGLTMAGGAMALLLTQNAASAHVPARVASSTIRAARSFAAGQAAASGLISARVAALTRGMLRTMIHNNLKTTSAVALGLAALLTLALAGSLSLAQPDDKQPEKPPPAPASRPAEKKTGWQQTYSIKHEFAVNLVACSATRAAAADEGGNMFIWDVKTGANRLLKIKGGKKETENGSLDRLQFTPDGLNIFGAQYERKAIFHLDLQDPKQPLVGIKADHPWQLGTSADGETWLESHNDNKTLGVRGNRWTANTVKEEYIKYDSEISHAVISPNDKWLAVATADGKVRLYERESLKETQIIPLKKESVTGVQFSQDGKRMAIVGNEGLGKLYDTATGKETAVLKAHKGIVFAVAFSPDGKTLVTGGDDHLARIWDASTGKQLHVLKGHSDSVKSVAFDPGSNLVVTGSADQTVRVWKLAE